MRAGRVLSPFRPLFTQGGLCGTMNAVYAKIIEMLDKSGLPHTLHDHPRVRTIEEAHEKVPHLTRNLIKTVVFRIKNGKWVLAAVNGAGRIHYKKLGDALGVKRKDLRSVSPDEVARELGFEVGGVGPFPVSPDVEVVFDRGLEGVGLVFCGSGINTRTVEMEIRDLIRLTGGRVDDIVKSEAPAD